MARGVGDPAEPGPERAVAPEEIREAPGEPPFIITGIGASAGGLEALETFLKNTPPDIGAGFVVVTHMDPAHKSMLSEILQRSTTMPVSQIEHGMKVRPNSVYVIPPNTDLTIQKGILNLEEPSRSRGMRLPIDHFFRRLAQDQDSKAVGILLSGMGHDGVLGLRSLKERLGTVMVQDPITAEFPSMPRSVIVSGLADYIAPAGELPKLLVNYIQSYRSLREAKPDAKRYTNARSKILAMIRSRTGEDYSMFKESLIRGRIVRRMGLHQIEDGEDYVRYVQEHPREIEILAQEIPTGPNWFFRNPEVWKILEEELLPGLVRDKPDGSTIRVWVSGCATGEQTYSMAIALEEAIQSSGRENEIQYQIFATDIDRERILEAREGLYIANIEVDVSGERLARFFTKRDDTYQIRQEIREKTVFAQHNILNHPPFLHLDILDVESLLLYTSPDVVQKLMPLFQYALNPGGILILGIDYSGQKPPEHFEPIDETWKIYRKTAAPVGDEGRVELPYTFTPPAGIAAGEPRPRKENETSSVAALAQEWLLSQYAPPAVIVNESGDILYFQGRTGKYLEPYPGRATLNVYTMARGGLRYPLTFAIRTALQEKRTVTRGPVPVQTNGSEETIRLTVRPIRQVEGAEGLLMVVFEPVQGSVPEIGRGEEPAPEGILQSDLDRELTETRVQLQRTVEDMQASQEELKSMNEELQSTNEELKSTNEELTSSKEELQSLNEELLTVNAEHQRKIEELSESNDDMRNLMQSTDIAMLFLDNDLRVRWFTDPIRPIVNLQSGDAGRPITDLAVNLRDGNLPGDLRGVLRTLQVQERVVQTADGKWYLMRILPYRTAENRIEGVVATFTDTSRSKELESSIRQAQTYAGEIMAVVHEPLLVLDAELRIVAASRSFYTTFQVAPEETEGTLIYDLGNRQWDIPQLHALFEEILPKGTAVEGFLVEHDFPGIGHRAMRLSARRFQSDAGADRIFLAIEADGDRPL
ncbi:chemotaxis protein CheB [Methanoculleus sp.]|uniref:chemotaxis protein CheB n=1 Tax=Methanoculleus sp. TaxID=90427 RepID=UPI002FC8AEF9